MRSHIAWARAIVAVLCLALLPARAAAQGAVDRISADTERDTARIDINGRPEGPPRSITLDDIVSFREVYEPRRSPDGRDVAFLVRQGFRDCNCYRTALYVVDTARGSVPRKLLEEELLADLRWTLDGRFLSYLSTRGGSQQLWRISRDGGVTEQVFTHTPGDDWTVRRWGYHPSDTTPVGVLRYEWSPDGKWIAFAVQPSPTSAQLKQASRAGVIWDDEKMQLWTNLLMQRWVDVPEQVWLYDLQQKRERLLWQAPQDIESFAWSPDGSRLAVSYQAPPVPPDWETLRNYDIGVLSVRDGTLTPVATGGAFEVQPRWAPDGRSVTFFSFLGELGMQRLSLQVVDLNGGNRRELARGVASVPRFWWSHDGQELFFEGDGAGKRRERHGLYAVSVQTASVRRVTPLTEDVSDCEGGLQHSALCVHQSSTLPPAPAIVDLAGGSWRALATINPELQNVAVSTPVELRWTNRYGIETNGYLLRPFGYQTGRRYPLLIITYGFHGGYVTDAEGLSSYPAQAFARDGFVVLMANFPRYDDWPGKSFARGSVAWGYSPLASIEAAVRMLTRQGLIDSSRVGMMGTSNGGWWTEFVITHSNLIRVASVTNPAGYNPVRYWFLGYHAAREAAELILGGPPYGNTLRNWVKFSPVFNTDKVRAPLLMEFDPPEAIAGMEMLAALRRHRIPAEFVIYPGGGHIFEQPEHRFHSMQRNLDWFRFWLKGEEDSDPSKYYQYARWHGLRSMQEQQRTRAVSLRGPD